MQIKRTLQIKTTQTRVTREPFATRELLKEKVSFSKLLFVQWSRSRPVSVPDMQTDKRTDSSALMSNNHGWTRLWLASVPLRLKMKKKWERLSDDGPLACVGGARLLWWHQVTSLVSLFESGRGGSEGGEWCMNSRGVRYGPVALMALGRRAWCWCNRNLGASRSGRWRHHRSWRIHELYLRETRGFDMNNWGHSSECNIKM